MILSLHVTFNRKLRCERIRNCLKDGEEEERGCVIGEAIDEQFETTIGASKPPLPEVKPSNSLVVSVTFDPHHFRFLNFFFTFVREKKNSTFIRWSNRDWAEDEEPKFEAIFLFYRIKRRKTVPLIAGFIRNVSSDRAKVA